MAERVKLGLWGGEAGDSRDIDGYPTRLTKIVITSSNQSIDSLAFDYLQDGKTFTAGPWGGSGEKLTTIQFGQDEYLTAINGTTGPFDQIAEVVTSLTFVTNLGNRWQFGKEQGTHFSVPIVDGKIVAFFGRFGTLVNAIGIYVTP